MSIQTLAKPLALALLLLASCGKPDAPQTNAGAAPSAATLEAAEVLATGTFSGLNDHVVTGGARILKGEGRTYLQLDGEFTLDGAPDPKVGFGRDGTYDTTTTLGALQSMQGTQSYELPEGFSLGTNNQAYIWCEDFSVPLGVATLAK